MKNICLIAFILLLASCVPQEEYSEIPNLEFKELYFAEPPGSFGQKFFLKMSFTDGDGDVGYHLDRPNDSIFDDSTSEYFYNFKVILQVYKNGVWVDSTNNEDTSNLLYYNANWRIPYITPDEPNKTLKGDIDVSNELPLPFNDTLRFKTWIYDRSLHKSNEVYTPGYFVTNL